MGLFHRHRWVDEARQYVRPAGDFEGPAVLAERMVSGWTIVTQRCAECGQRRQDTLLGDLRYIAVEALDPAEPKEGE